MTESERMSRRDELETLLPFYLNGTLDGHDLAAVEEWLATDPQALVALADAEAEYSGVSEVNDALRPPSDSISRFAKALDAEAGADRAGAPSILSRLWERFMAVPAAVAWGAAAAALALFLVQAVVEPGRPIGNVEIAGTDEAAKMPFVFVTFVPQATIADVAAFLSENGATMLAGPAAGGVFKIAIPAQTVADYDRIGSLIAAQPFVDTVVPGRKPADGG